MIVCCRKENIYSYDFESPQPTRNTEEVYSNYLEASDNQSFDTLARSSESDINSESLMEDFTTENANNEYDYHTTEAEITTSETTTTTEEISESTPETTEASKISTEPRTCNIDNVFSKLNNVQIFQIILPSVWNWTIATVLNFWHIAHWICTEVN